MLVSSDHRRQHAREDVKAYHKESRSELSSSLKGGEDTMQLDSTLVSQSVLSTAVSAGPADQTCGSILDASSITGTLSSVFTTLPGGSLGGGSSSCSQPDEQTHSSAGHLQESNQTVGTNAVHVRPSYVCRGFDPNIPHFDGRDSAPDEQYLIDLDTDSMERYPDVRQYFWFVGYFLHRDAHPHATSVGEDREQECVRAGRLHLQRQRRVGQGLYLGPRDYAALKSDKHDCMPWFNTVLELSHDPVEMATHGDLGTWDSVGDYALTLLGHGSLLLTNVRAPMLPLSELIVRPGEFGWDSVVLSSYADHIITTMGYIGPIEGSWWKIISNTLNSGNCYTEDAMNYYSHHTNCPTFRYGCVCDVEVLYEYWRHRQPGD